MNHAPHHHHGHCHHDHPGTPAPVAPRAAPPVAGDADTTYTCPMHPEVRQQGPGSCPICGMALEPLTPSAASGDNPELVDMTRRFIVAAALAFPLLLMAMSDVLPFDVNHLIDSLGSRLGLPPLAHVTWSQWLQAVLAAPVVLWAGRPFLERGWRSFATWRLNMFSLIALGVAAAFLFSVFALLLPDMIMHSQESCLKGMVDLYEESGGNVVAVQECDPAEAHKYGIVAKGAEVGGGFEITAMVEKPARGTAPSNLYINGRYILQPEIFAILENQERGAGGEIQLTDAMIRLGETQKMFGFHYRGDTYDCGSPEGFVEANLAFALRRDDLREVVESVMARLAGTSRG